MLATRTSAGSGAAVTHTEWGRSARAIRRMTIAFSSRSLSLLQQLLAEVFVDRRVGAPPRGAGERHRAGALAVAAHEQLGAGGDERAVTATDREHVARRERLPEQPQHGADVVIERGVDLHLAREHDLLELAGANPLHRPRHRLLVVRRGHRAEHLVLPRRRRVEHRQRRRAQLRQTRRHARLEIRRDVIGRHFDVTVSATRSPLRASEARAPPARPGRSRPTAATRRRRARTQTRRARAGPSPAGASGASASAAAATADQRLATVSKRSSPRASSVRTDPIAATA